METKEMIDEDGRVYNIQKQVIDLDQFTATFHNAVSGEMCSEFVKWFDEISKQGFTGTSVEHSKQMYKEYELSEEETAKKEESIDIYLGFSVDKDSNYNASIPAKLPKKHFPINLCKPLWEILRKCNKFYLDKYNIKGSMISHNFIAHREHPTGEPPVWHYGHTLTTLNRVLGWQLTLEVPEKGGEMEFFPKEKVSVTQSLKIEPIVGQLIMWPAGFTHKFCNVPPLKGQKTYLTGWFNIISPHIFHQ